MMSRDLTELRHVFWGVATTAAAELLTTMAQKRLRAGIPWRVVEGTQLVALLVGDGVPDDRFAGAVAKVTGSAYLLDFDDEAASTQQFRGDGRPPTYVDGHPAGILRDHGIVVPGFEPRPHTTHTVLLVDSVPPNRVRKVFARDDMQFTAHPRGTLVVGGPPTVGTQYARALKTRVYRAHYNPVDGYFECTVKRPDGPSEAFFIGENPNAEIYVVVNSILGATTPLGVCKALEIEPSLLGLTDE
jgi:hypothetical protein